MDTMDTKETKADAGPPLPDSCTPEFEAIISSLGHTLQGTGAIETQKAFNEHMDSVEEVLEEKAKGDSNYFAFANPRCCTGALIFHFY